MTSNIDPTSKTIRTYRTLASLTYLNYTTHLQFAAITLLAIVVVSILSIVFDFSALYEHEIQKYLPNWMSDNISNTKISVLKNIGDSYQLRYIHIMGVFFVSILIGFLIGVANFLFFVLKSSKILKIYSRNNTVWKLSGMIFGFSILFSINAYHIGVLTGDGLSGHGVLNRPNLHMQISTIFVSIYSQFVISCYLSVLTDKAMRLRKMK